MLLEMKVQVVLSALYTKEQAAMTSNSIQRITHGVAACNGGRLERK